MDHALPFFDFGAAGERLPSFDLSAIWPARSVPTLADLFANLDLGVPVVERVLHRAGKRLSRA